MIIRNTLLLSTLLCATVLSTASAVADSILEFITRSNGEEWEQTIYITNTQLRMDVNRDIDKNSLLFDAKTETLIMLDHQQKTYMEINKETAARLSKARQDMQQVLDQLQGQMQGMSAEERQALEQMIAQIGDGAKQEKHRLEQTGHQQTVSGFNCRIVNVYRGQHKEQELCLASPDTLGLSEAQYQTFQAMMATTVKMAGEEAGALAEINGIPVRTVDYGQDQQVIELQRIIQESVSAELFTIPADYSRQDPLARD